jgi:hypothetical protein
MCSGAAVLAGSPAAAGAEAAALLGDPARRERLAAAGRARAADLGAAATASAYQRVFESVLEGAATPLP